MHHYYKTETIDLAKLREDATLRAEGRWIYSKHPESSVIHFHSKREPCEGNSHEQYEVKK